MTRKSPVKHKVRTHTRNGATVHRYERGDGEVPQPVYVIGAPTVGFGGYSVTVQYSGGSERVRVNAGSFGAALSGGLAGAKKPDVPVAVVVRRY